MNASHKGFDWRGTTGTAEKPSKKERQKPHWLVAKEHGKRKNGSEKRKNKKRDVDDDGETAPPPPMQTKKAKKEQKGAAVQVRQMERDEQREFVMAELNQTVVDAKSIPLETFLKPRGGVEGFGAGVKDVLDQMDSKLWKRRIVTDRADRNVSFILVMSYGALRCVDLIADLRKQLPQGETVPTVAKLFAKHLKMDQQIDHLNTHYVGIGCGTPNRITKLVEEKALKIDSTVLLVIDCAINVKNQSIFSMPETRGEVLAFLATMCSERLANGKMKIALI